MAESYRNRESMRALVLRHPFIFSLLLVLILFLLAPLSQLAFPAAPVGSVEDVAPTQLERPSELSQFSSVVRSAETLTLVLGLLLTGGLLTWLGWWREAGFGPTVRWRNLRLLWFPVLVVALALASGVLVSGPGALASAVFLALLVSINQESIFRGVMLRALAPRGLVRAVVATSLLSGLLTFGWNIVERSWPETLYVTVLAACAGFTYAALRWRIASIWPVLAFHFVFAVVVDVTEFSLLYPLFLLCSTVGFIVYGLFLLRNRRVREDGGISVRESAQVR